MKCLLFRSITTILIRKNKSFLRIIKYFIQNQEVKFGKWDIGIGNWELGFRIWDMGYRNGEWDMGTKKREPSFRIITIKDNFLH